MKIIVVIYRFDKPNITQHTNPMTQCISTGSLFLFIRKNKLKFPSFLYFDKLKT